MDFTAHTQKRLAFSLASHARDLAFIRGMSPALAAWPADDVARELARWSEKWAGAPWVKATRTTVGVFEGRVK